MLKIVSSVNRYAVPVVGFFCCFMGQWFAWHEQYDRAAYELAAAAVFFIWARDKD